MRVISMIFMTFLIVVSCLSHGLASPSEAGSTAAASSRGTAEQHALPAYQGSLPALEGTDFSEGPAVAQPALRLLFIANTRGLTEPCRTCGNRALGGIARRCTMLDMLRGTQPVLFLAGPYEFAASPELEAVSIIRDQHTAPDRLRAAAAFCAPDAGYLTQHEAGLFSGKKLPEGYVTVGNTPCVRRLRTAGGTVAVIMLPELPSGADTVPDQMLRAVLEAGRSQADADLVIGVSPWGFSAEGRALPALDGVYDVLLGGGAGAPFPIDVTAFAPGVIWARSDSDGRTIIELGLDVLPGAARPHPWIRDVDVRGREWLLGPAVKDHAGARAALAAEEN